MKKMWKDRFNIIAILCLATFVLIACNGDKKTSENKDAQQYTCPMHPQIIKDQPDTCPICGMDLVPMHSQDLKLEVDTNLAALLQPSDEAVVSNIKTFKVSSSTVSDTLILNGVVSYNTNNMKTISSRINGRIEKLYVKYNYQMVSKGQKIMEIYSPDLAAAQQELLYLKTKGDLSLLEQAKTKLRLLGVSENQINEVLRSGKTNYKIAVYSPASGYLVNPASISSTTKAISSDEMGQQTSATIVDNKPVNMVEGQYVSLGQVLFKLFNQQEVWAEFYSNPDESHLIKEKNLIQISSKNGKTTNARIDLIQPFYNDGQNYSVIRVYLKNMANEFRIGELLKATIVKPQVFGRWIPAKSVYQLGEKNIVFIKNGNTLKPLEVSISEKAGTHFLIKTGLKEGDEIAVNASYLIDTESFIQTN
ncbi:HlyD family efflux transporter periplasmic adaptor subunit [Pedobacter cryophilus]|uniref:Efflux RND transporter periplasmic adaptor subunit n=1 Tax=Pedobacter cryophilus TaxID=2571271 RepID=A0A4U1BYT3_9SPHI|nr:HlyD family efflux transporter periplasmic adaptor subunit [Pedobacter cryophilus]TKB97915.1 efflux RND transporter periplasmic adaptor subunit [Pedobacter cryophilus]